MNINLIIIATGCAYIALGLCFELREIRRDAFTVPKGRKVITVDEGVTLSLMKTTFAGATSTEADGTQINSPVLRYVSFDETGVQTNKSASPAEERPSTSP